MRKETRRAEREGIMIRMKMIPTVKIQKNYYKAPQKTILIKKKNKINKYIYINYMGMKISP